jgi:hypothetical protein
MSELSEAQYTHGYDLTRKAKSLEYLTERTDELWEGDFLPFRDDQFFHQRLTSPSRLFRREPEFKQQILADLSAECTNEQLVEITDYIDVARQMVAPSNEKPLNTFFSLVTIITDLNNSTPGGYLDPMSSRVNVVGSLLAEKIANGFEPEQLLEAQAYSINMARRLEEMYALTRKRYYETFHDKIDAIARRLVIRRHALNYVESLPADGVDIVSTAEAKDHSAFIRELFEEIRATQKYGVKMGYVPDDEFGSFIFHPSVDFAPMLSTNTAPGHIDASSLVAGTNAVAEVIHSKSDNPRKVRPNIVLNQEGNDLYWDVTALEPWGIMYIGKDGEIYSDRLCQDPIVNMAIAAGKYTAYRNQQAKILAHYYDATHAIEPNDNNPAATSVPIIHSAVQTADRTPLDSINRLIIPRLRNQSEQSDKGDMPIHTVRRHDVTWHVRKLPKGWKASQAGIDLAKQLGVRIEEGETIVKDHKRGSELLGEVVGYRLIKRQ